MTEEVEPDYKHAWKLFKDLLLLPLTLLLVLFRRKELKDVFAPLKDLWNYFWDAKFTAILIIINIIAFFVVIGILVTMPEQQQIEFSHEYLMDGPSNLVGFKIIPFVTNWFVHLSWGHLLGNMLALFILGRVVEKNFGPWKFALIYFGSAIISGVVDDLVHLSNMEYFANGASGAIAGLASAAMLAEPFYLVCIFIVPIPVLFFGWLQLYTDITGILDPLETTVANFAHLGGFFAITILAFFMSSEEKSKLLRGLLINAITFLLFAGIWWYSKLHSG